MTRATLRGHPFSLKMGVPSTVRLQVYLAQCGAASRRRSAKIIESGMVSVNGRTVTERGFPVDPERDQVSVSGRGIRPEEKVYFLFHKPHNVVTTARDPQGRRTVLDYFRSIPHRVFPVGRLDRNTTGLLLLTNDGPWAQRVSHPRYGLEKTYEALLRRPLAQDEMVRFERIFEVNGKKTAPCRIRSLGKRDRYFLYEVRLHEGRNRQIRRMMEKVNAGLQGLHRSRIGSLGLGTLRPGAYRKLTPEEIHFLGEHSPRG